MGGSADGHGRSGLVRGRESYARSVALAGRTLVDETQSEAASDALLMERANTRKPRVGGASRKEDRRGQKAGRRLAAPAGVGKRFVSGSPVMLVRCIGHPTKGTRTLGLTLKRRTFDVLTSLCRGKQYISARPHCTLVIQGKRSPKRFWRSTQRTVAILLNERVVGRPSKMLIS